MVRRLTRMPFQMHFWGIPQTDAMITPGSTYGLPGKVDTGAYWEYVTADPVRFIVQFTARGVNALLIFLALFLLRGRTTNQAESPQNSVPS